MLRHRPATVVGLLLLALLLTGAPALAAPAPAPALAPAPGSTSQRPDLQPLLEAVVDAGAPGVAAFVRDDEGVWQGAAGRAGAGSDRAMTPDLRFRVASLSKPFVATVVLQLVDEDRLSLDDTVDTLLPGVLPDGEAFTVRHLLQHTSGIPDVLQHSMIDFWADPRGRHRAWTPTELVATVADGPRLFPPGSDWSYSNTNYVLLGMVVEDLTGQRIDRVLEQRIIRPLGLDDTWLPVQARSFGGPYAHGTSFPFDTDFQVIGPPKDATHYNPSFVGAAGALVSTPADLAAFETALLDGDLLPDALLAEMRTTVPIGVPLERYGLGLHELDLPCGTAVGHTGSLPGYWTYAFSSPDASQQVMLLMNTDALTQDLLFAFLEAFFTAFCGDLDGARTTVMDLAPTMERELIPRR